ncbi:MAG: phytoene desaturase family protein [Spirochaetia bacterium]|nr:phytoene desaturase family protein [Spirochaetota bacterium]MCX8097009.1 phytoene desaturase family protein [Spirochaetota bacterium]MDW8111908.1 phytoene desaturase family protein [Spirochaetia bacterium]
MKAIIVGSGIGGLTSAVELRSLGLDVEVLEKNPTIGGRMNFIRKDGYYFDTGPSLLIMLKPLKDLFEKNGRKLEDYLKIKLIDPTYRVYFEKDGSVLEPSVIIPNYLAQIPNEIGNLLKFFGDISNMYHFVITNLVYKNFNTIFDMITPKGAYNALKFGFLSNLYRKTSSYFKDYRLKWLNTFQSMYLGVSPYDAPFAYAVVNYMESVEGVYYALGGMYKVAEAIAKLAQEMGVKITTNTEVKSVVNSNGKKVVITNRGEYDADIVVVNADLTFAKEKLLNKKVPKYKHSCSTLMYYIGYEGQTELLHHNVFFGTKFKEVLDDIFKSGKFNEDISFYVHISAKTDPEHAPKNSENIYILVPVSNLEVSKEDYNTLSQNILNIVFDRLEKRTSFRRDKVKFVITRTPNDWQSLYNLYQGSTFGISHTLFQSAYFRPKNYEKDIKGLYYVGASTIPGSGIPMVIISAQLVKERIKNDYGL